ncbi:MAG TPA: hypothetical protein DCQ31_09775 [Bacteroidales bacterium]|nr:hypothetical protein [Bacteroidales bacterium]
MNLTLLQVQISEMISPASNTFIWQVYVPIMAWMVLVIVLLGLLVKKYTFGNWTKENPNPYSAETLELPRGVFRAIITITLLYVVIVLELVNVYVQDFELQIQEFMVSFQMMIAFYFGSKVMHHVTAADKSKSKAKSEAQVASVTSGSSYSSSSSSNTASTDTASTDSTFVQKDDEAAG